MLPPALLHDRLRDRSAAPLILDGGLATALEQKGFDLADPLWSAKLLIEAPEAIRQVHHEYLHAGADCITAASYQASLPGFAARGISSVQGRELIVRAVELAVQARDAFWAHAANRVGRVRPLVAASVGPYGAYLADGSEYTGTYAVADHALYDFHAERWHLLADSGADLLACETIPASREVAVLLSLSRESPGVPLWMSVCCGSEQTLWDGSFVSDVGRSCELREDVVAVGVNCVKPHLVQPLLHRLRQVTAKPLIAYPNAGEDYDAASGCWLPSHAPAHCVGLARAWVAAGARAIGGCCRVGTEQIHQLRDSLHR
ncbi:MAG: homocysteine S-methyltransferase [Pseudomonadota bacterium]